jgi:hypothetical protein
LEQVAAARDLPRATFADYVGEPIDSFYNKEFCATTPVQTARGEAVAPLAFGSALAGFLLAHAATAPTTEGARRFRMDVVTGLSTPIRSSPLPREGCQYCGRDVFRRVHEARWDGQSEIRRR